jgi:hypothetical protein
VRVDDIVGNWVVMQQSPSNIGYGVWMETGSPTAHPSGFIPMVAGKRYAFSLLANYPANNGKLAIFDPANNFAQVGSTLTSSIGATTSEVAKVYVGNLETGTSSGTTYFEDVMFDWTNHIFPKYPKASVAAGPAPPTSLSAVVQ